MFDTQYDVQWIADGQLSGESIRMPRTDLFRKKPVVTKPMLKAWIAEVAACENIQVCCALSDCSCIMRCADSVIQFSRKVVSSVVTVLYLLCVKRQQPRSGCACGNGMLVLYKATATDFLIIHKFWT